VADLLPSRIPAGGQADATLSSILEGFGQIRADRDVFDGGRRGSEAAAGGDGI